jgi:NAD dependent epimerase/dehydratase family enzyme
MSPVFKTGLGGRLGDGSQYWSWIAMDDLLAAFEWALHDEGLEGAVNFTAPEPLTNRAATETLGRVLHRPAKLSAPAAVLRYGLNGLGEEMMLASQRAVPERLEEQGFRFAFPELEGALRYELGRA